MRVSLVLMRPISHKSGGWRRDSIRSSKAQALSTALRQRPHNVRLATCAGQANLRCYSGKDKASGTLPCQQGRRFRLREQFFKAVKLPA